MSNKKIARSLAAAVMGSLMAGLLVTSLGCWACVSGRPGETLRPNLCYVYEWPAVALGSRLPWMDDGIKAIFVHNACDFCTTKALFMAHVRVAGPFYSMLFGPIFIFCAIRKRM